MPRQRRRICLEAGLKLELYKLMRQGCVIPGSFTAFHTSWSNNYTNEQTAIAVMSADMRAKHEGYLRVQMHDLDQTIILTPRARSLGGHQWYFMCPYEDRCCWVLWRPPGANGFRCRQGWGRRVAYTSQFLDRDHRAHRGKAKIKAKLLGDCDPDEWELPPKPKWIRWRTYNRLADRFASYQEILDEGMSELLAKLFAPSE
jgi:hypothetical protein